MSTEFIPEQLNLSTDSVVVIGTVALPSGPVRISVSTAPKIALAQNASGYSSVKNVGKEDSMLTITAIFNEEFIDSAELKYKGINIPADMYSLLSLLELMPFVPIYSRELAKLISGNAGSDYFFGALQSIAVRQYSDFDRTYEVTMSFLITDISPYLGNIVGFKEFYGDSQSVVSSMYLSGHIKNLISKRKLEMVQSYYNSNNISIGIDSFTVVNNLRKYIAKIKNVLSDISTSYSQDYQSEISSIDSQISAMEKNMEESLNYTFNEINHAIKNAVDNSTVIVGKSSFENYSTYLYKLMLDNIVNISVGYDNYMSPTYMQDSAVAIHSFMGRSPVSAQISFVCQNADDVNVFKTLYYMIQKLHRDVDFVGYSMPATITGEIFNLVDMKNATITKIDVSSMDDVPNGFLVNVVFVDGSKGITNESATPTITDDGTEIAKNVIEEACKAIAEAAGTPVNGLMQYFIDNDFDTIANKISDTDKLYREIILNVASIIDALAQSVVNISIAGGLLKTDYTPNSKDSAFRTKYIAPYFDGGVPELKESSVVNKDINIFSTPISRSLVILNALREGRNASDMYGLIASEFGAAYENNSLSPFLKDRVLKDLVITKKNTLEFVEEIPDENIPLFGDIAQWEDVPGAEGILIQPVLTEDVVSKYMGENPYIGSTGTQEVDYRELFLKAYSCALYGDSDTTFDFTNVWASSKPGANSDVLIWRKNAITKIRFLATSSNPPGSAHEETIRKFAEKLDSITAHFENKTIEIKKENPYKLIYSTNPKLFPQSDSYFEFSSSLISLIQSIVSGNESINEEAKLRTAYEDAVEYDESRDIFVAEDGSVFVKGDYLAELKGYMDSEILPYSQDVAKMICGYIRGDAKSAREYIYNYSFMSSKLSEAYYAFEYNLSKAIATSDEVLLDTYGKVIKESVMRQSLKEYLSVNPYDFYVEGHDYRIIDSILNNIDGIATETKAIFSGDSLIKDIVALDGTLLKVSDNSIVNFMTNVVKTEIDKFNNYLSKNSYSENGQFISYKDMYSEIVKSGSTAYVSGDKVLAMHKELESKGIIKLVPKKDDEGAVITENGKTVKEYVLDESKLETEDQVSEFIDIMDKYLIDKKDKSRYIISDSYSKEQYDREIYGISEAIRNSSLSIENMCPQMYVVLMWTKSRLFIPVQYMFEYRGVISVEIQKSREDPGDKAVVVLSNTKGILTNSTTNDYQYIDKNMEGISTIDKLLIKEGVAMQLISFSKNRKVKIFEGIISGAQYDGNTVTIVADGYGSQLMKPVYEKDQKLGGGCTNPREMVIDAITRSNSIRLGCPQSGYFELLKRMVENKYKEDYIWLYSDKFLFPTLRYTDMGINVYAPDQYWPLLLKPRIKGISYFEQYQADYKAKAGYSAWDVITDAANRVPGFIAAVTDFDSGGGRVFFGKPEWTYVYTSKLDPQFWSRAKDVTAKNFMSKVNVINNVINNELETYEQRIVEAFNSLVKYDIEPVVMNEETINGFVFNIPEDIPTADESEGTVVPNIIKSTGVSQLYDGDTLYTSYITGTREGYRFIGYDAEELLDNQGNVIELGAKQRDAAYNIIDHFGAKLLVVPMYTDTYGRHVSYVYVKYSGPIKSLKDKWINLSSLMIASGYIKTLETGYHQDSEFLRKNILYNNYNNKYHIDETEGALYENSKAMYENISNKFGALIQKKRTNLREDIEIIRNNSGLNEADNDKYFNEAMNGIDDLMDKMSNIIFSITGEYVYEEKNNKLADIGISAGSINMFITEAIEAGSIENTSVYRAVIEPFDSIKSAILTVSSAMSDTLRLSTQYYNLTETLNNEQAPKRVFSVIDPFKEYENFINMPGTKKFRDECIAVSRVNLISNGIMTDSANVYNEIIFKGRRNDADVWPVFKQVWRFIKSIFGVSDGNVDGDDQIHTIIADINIPEWERKTLMASDEWADTFQTRIIVGTSILINALKNMYQGEITIIGNPSIKPHDMIYIHDEQNDIDGTAIIRTVRHHFGQGIGFVTRIEVDPIIEARDLSISRSAVWLSNIARIAVAGAIISAAVLTGGTALLPAMGAFSAGVATSVGVNKIIKSIYTDHVNYAAVNGQMPYQENNESIGPYISKDIAFNLLKIKPLSKSGRPMVAGLNGYSPENISSIKYIADRAKLSWSDFVLGMKMYGYGFEYLGNSINSTFSDIYSDLLQYRESLK